MARGCFVFFLSCFLQWRWIHFPFQHGKFEESLFVDKLGWCGFTCVMYQNVKTTYYQFFCVRVCRLNIWFKTVLCQNLKVQPTIQSVGIKMQHKCTSVFNLDWNLKVILGLKVAKLFGIWIEGCFQEYGNILLCQFGVWMSYPTSTLSSL